MIRRGNSRRGIARPPHKAQAESIRDALAELDRVEARSPKIKPAIDMFRRWSQCCELPNVGKTFSREPGEREEHCEPPETASPRIAHGSLAIDSAASQPVLKAA